MCILQYTIWKNQKSIYDTIHVLTTIQRTHKDQITLLKKKKKNKKKKKKIKSHILLEAPFTCNCIDVADRWIWSISLLVGIGCVLFFWWAELGMYLSKRKCVVIWFVNLEAVHIMRFINILVLYPCNARLN